MKKFAMSSVVLIALLVATVVSASLVFADEPVTTSGTQENHSDCAYGQGDKWAIKIAAAAEVLGMTVEEIEAEVQAGKSLPAIAQVQGVEVQTLRDAVHSAMRAAGYSCGCGSH